MLAFCSLGTWELKSNRVHRNRELSKHPYTYKNYAYRCMAGLGSDICIWVRSRNFGCLVTWFCYQLIAKPGNKTATVSWPDPYIYILCEYALLFLYLYLITDEIKYFYLYFIGIFAVFERYFSNKISHLQICAYLEVEIHSLHFACIYSSMVKHFPIEASVKGFPLQLTRESFDICVLDSRNLYLIRVFVFVCVPDEMYLIWLP